MKKKHTLILLCMLVFTGIILLGYNPAWALDNGWWRDCGSADHAYAGGDEPGECQIFYFDGFGNAFVMRAFIGFVDPPGANGPEEPLDVTIGVNWPIPEERDGVDVDVYKYLVIPYKLVNKNNKPATPSYSLMRLQGNLPIEFEPSGSGEYGEDAYNECGETLLSPFYYLKQNGHMPWNKFEIYELVVPRGTPFDECGEVLLKISDKCEGAAPGTFVYLPLLGTLLAETSRTFECAGWESLTIQPGECGGPPVITCGDGTNPVRHFNNPSFVWELPAEGDIPAGTHVQVYLQNVGLDPGSAICTDGGTGLVTGSDVYLCDQPAQ